MMKSRGFALALVLFLMPLLAMLAWTFLKVGSVTRAQAITEERGVRSLQAAEAGIRSYLVTGQPGSFELNDCEVVVSLQGANLVSTAKPIHGNATTRIILETEKGFVVRRMTNERG